MEIYKKINTARKIIKSYNLKKSGRNTYSNYDYFTPSQIANLVSDACIETRLFHKFDLKKNELGMYGELTIVDLESPENTLIFTQITDIPNITATNVAQQIGGAVTFTKRYLLMTVFDIVQDSLDFDDKNNSKKKDDNLPRIWLDDKKFNEFMIITEKKELEKKITGFSFSVINGKKYCMKKEFSQKLKNRLKTL